MSDPCGCHELITITVTNNEVMSHRSSEVSVTKQSPASDLLPAVWIYTHYAI